MGAARQSWTCCWTVGRERTLSHTWTLVSFPWKPEPDLSVSVDPRVTCPWLGREAPTPYASRLSQLSPSGPVDAGPSHGHVVPTSVRHGDVLGELEEKNKKK